MYWRCHLPYVTPRSRGRHFCRRGALRGGLRVRFDEPCLSLLHPSRGPLCKIATDSQGGIIVGSSTGSIPEGIRGNFLRLSHIDVRVLYHTGCLTLSANPRKLPVNPPSVRPFSFEKMVRGCIRCLAFEWWYFYGGKWEWNEGKSEDEAPD